MSPMAKVAVLFVVFVFLCLLIYLLVVRAFYWGDRKGPPPKPKRVDKTDPDR